MATICEYNPARRSVQRHRDRQCLINALTVQVVVIALGKDPNSSRTVHIALAVEQS
jgi:hypothetical protein